MALYTGSKYYLDNGRLDLSGLDKEAHMISKEEPVMEITDRELIDLQENNTAGTLEEMALMFETQEPLVNTPKVPRNPSVEIDDEFTKAFNEQRLQEEIQEFGIKRREGIDNHTIT